MAIHLYVGEPGSGKTIQMLKDSKHDKDKPIGFIDGADNQDSPHMYNYRHIREIHPDVLIWTNKSINNAIIPADGVISHHKLMERKIKCLLIDEGEFAFKKNPELFEIIKTMDEVRITFMYKIPKEFYQGQFARYTELKPIIHEMPTKQMRFMRLLNQFKFWR